MNQRSFYDLNFCLKHFFYHAQKDPRMTSSHMALYFSLVNSWLASEKKGEIRLFGKQGSRQAKISIACYYACLRDLHDFGYIHYLPSFNKTKASRIFLKPRFPQDGSTSSLPATLGAAGVHSSG